MKILYISPENTVGTLGLWKRAHESRGNECTIITLYDSKYHNNESVCLNLPMIKSNDFYINCRYMIGAKAEYLKEGSITFSNPSDGPVQTTFSPNESKTDVMQISLGLNFNIK